VIERITMSIANLVINVQDLERSVNFYRRHLSAEIVERDEARCLLDLVTTTIELRTAADLAANPWEQDDAVRGFRHIGFKVADVDLIARGLENDGVEMRVPPHENDQMNVRVCFFADPDGVALELVERHLKYHRVVNAAAVEAEYAEPTPVRPRFDHVGVSVADTEGAIARYEALGFTRTGWAKLGLRGELELDFLRAGRTIVELLSWADADRFPVVDPRARGFSAMEFDKRSDLFAEAAASTTLADGRKVFIDPDGVSLASAAD